MSHQAENNKWLKIALLKMMSMEVRFKNLLFRLLFLIRNILKLKLRKGKRIKIMYLCLLRKLFKILSKGRKCKVAAK